MGSISVFLGIIYKGENTNGFRCLLSPSIRALAPHKRSGVRRTHRTCAPVNLPSQGLRLCNLCRQSMYQNIPLSAQTASKEIYIPMSISLYAATWQTDAPHQLDPRRVARSRLSSGCVFSTLGLVP